MPSLRCPICRREFLSEESPAMPFCSQRCKLVDLNAWLDEKYGMPVEPEAQESAAPENDTPKSPNSPF